MMEWLTVALVATFTGTLAAFAALNPARPLPWEAGLAALCFTIAVGAIIASIGRR